MTRDTRIEFSTISSLEASGDGPLIRHSSALGAGGGRSGELFDEKMMPSPPVRSGKRAAKICAIIPPIDAPTMWARSIPK